MGQQTMMQRFCEAVGMSNFSMASLLILITLICGSCSSDDDMPEGPTEPNVPDTPVVDLPTYTFERNGTTSVFHTGQVVRNILVQDAKALILSLTEPDAEPIEYEDLYKYYDNDGVTISVHTYIQTDPPVMTTYLPEISGNRDLRQRLNWGYIEEVNGNVESWSQRISDNSKDDNKLGTPWVYIDDSTGYDLSERWPIQVLGSTAWSHGLWNYFRFVHEKENDVLVSFGNDTANYTEMEHHMDEVFGYFGASEHYLSFEDEDVINGVLSKDNVLEDGQIDLRTEYNFVFARMAAWVDIWSSSSVDYSGTMFRAFVSARQAIVDKQYDTLLIHKAIILPTWEEIVAIHAVHHLNACIASLEQLEGNPSQNPLELYRHWSAMYQYTDILKYNYDNRFVKWEEVLLSHYTDSEVRFPKDLYDNPERIASYIDKLEVVRQIFGNVYGFSQLDLLNY